ncbi:MAG: Gfo/Idh/MocA family oxidoreductase [Caldilineaceae bacterium]
MGLRIGTLGAARITPKALILSARLLPEVEVSAIAARSLERAKAFAQVHQIPKVYDNYQALLDDPTIDVVYNPLPNSLHAEWSIKALRAGKHVLCEKPIASNAQEARQMATVAAETGLVLMEAFHNLYHPLVKRMKEIVKSGELGTIRHIEGHFCTILRRLDDIRYRWDLAGGATMDLGCYPLRLMRHLLDEVPTVTYAHASCIKPQVDRWMEAKLQFPSGATGRMTCAFFSLRLIRLTARVVGDTGEMHVLNPIMPHLFNRLTFKSRTGSHSESFRGESSYTHQLRTFVEAVQQGTTLLTDGNDGVVSMQVIDEVYRKAGLKPRST